jgi:predicted 3-demethylubiquinone-9 3-methyltransferase (glyoxalase superfamily)
MTGKAFTACLRFDAEGEAAASFYASIFKGSKLGRLDRYTKAMPGPAKDKYGLSWQVIPDALIDMIRDPDPGRAKRATEAMSAMTRLDIVTLQKAYAEPT